MCNVKRKDDWNELREYLGKYEIIDLKVDGFLFCESSSYRLLEGTGLLGYELLRLNKGPFLYTPIDKLFASFIGIQSYQYKETREHGISWPNLGGSFLYVNELFLFILCLSNISLNC